MNGVRQFLKTTLIGGLLVVLPIAVIAVLAVRASTAIHKVLAPPMAHLPFPGLFPGLLAVVILVGVCFVTGLLIHTPPGRWLGSTLERSVLGGLPGYTLLKSAGRRAVGATEEGALSAALAQTDDGLIPAIVVEEHADGSFTVFIPAVPTPAAGSLFVMPRERVHRLDVPVKLIAKCVSQWGVGTDELVRALHAQRADTDGPTQASAPT